MKLCFLDFETQGSDPRDTNITEIGATIADLTQDDCGKIQSWSLRPSFSRLVYDPSYPPQTEEIVSITHITDEMLKKDGYLPRDAFYDFADYCTNVDYFVAHNVSFDKTVYHTVGQKLKVITILQPMGGWICTVMDVPYPPKYRCKKLSHLAYDHGMIVDPSTLHRASADTELLAKFILTHYDINEIIAYRDSPWIYLKADVPGPWQDQGVGTTLAKKRGYSFEKVWGTEKPVFSKTWVKRVKQKDLETELNHGWFPVVQLETK